MKILLSGICGFVGSSVAHGLLDHDSALELVGLDNLSRAGSHLNIEPLRQRGVKLSHADLRSPSDLEAITKVDWIIDAAANPSVLAGIDGATSSRQLLEHNLYGTVNLLELAKRRHAGFILLSTSRVYSVRSLADIPVVVMDGRFEPDSSSVLPQGVSSHGIAKIFRRRHLFRSTEARSWPRNVLPWNTAKRSNSPSGSIGVASSPARGSLGEPTRGSFPFGLTPI